MSVSAHVIKGAEVYSQVSICYPLYMIQPEQLVGDEWAEWYRLTPAQRWLESEKLWQTYLALGGSLDPEPDTQSPFFDARESKPASTKQRIVDQTIWQQWARVMTKRHAK
ncbi:MAG: hypothetical protein IH623_27855 [Verrucomicrobia bacterium]|nr:hypothetical protein [Verrucomicrobiota bacterium]